ncbi:MAG: TRAP transporter small permease subunit [Pseudomonadota bacterium]
MRVLRRLLDWLYTGCGILAAIFLVAILLLIVLQMSARWTGEIFPGAPEYAGYCMAAASFFAFASALNHGSHIRVSIVLNLLSRRAKRIVDGWCFLIGAALAWYFTYYAFQAIYWSWLFNDISQGQDASPIWIPQMAMGIGAGVFAIALTDNLLHVLFFGDNRIKTDIIEQSHGE